MLLELFLSSSLSLEQDFTPSSGAALWIFSDSRRATRALFR